MIAIGADVHKRKCTLAVQREDGEVKMLPSMENTRENWLRLLAQLPPEAEIALEVSTSGHFVMSVLEEAGWRERGHWVHTAGIDSLRKRKNDRLDTKRLARKLSVAKQEPLPEAWFPPLPIRELRLRARARCWTAIGRAQCRNRLNSLLQMYGLRREKGSLWTRPGRAWLAKQKLTAAARESAERIVRLQDFFEAERDSSEKSLVAASASFPQIAQMVTIPGVGRMLAAVIWSEIGDLDRFESADALVNYTGLAPSLYESGEVSRQGGITHQGPVWLRWALVTAANSVTRSRSPLGRRYHRLVRHKPGNVAKAAVAKTIARCVYGILKHGGEYQEERWGRKPGIEMER